MSTLDSNQLELVAEKIGTTKHVVNDYVLSYVERQATIDLIMIIILGCAFVFLLYQVVNKYPTKYGFRWLLAFITVSVWLFYGHVPKYAIYKKDKETLQKIKLQEMYESFK